MWAQRRLLNKQAGLFPGNKGQPVQYLRSPLVLWMYVQYIHKTPITAQKKEANLSANATSLRMRIPIPMQPILRLAILPRPEICPMAGVKLGAFPSSVMKSSPSRVLSACVHMCACVSHSIESYMYENAFHRPDPNAIPFPNAAMQDGMGPKMSSKELPPIEHHQTL